LLNNKNVALFIGNIKKYVFLFKNLTNIFTIFSTFMFILYIFTNEMCGKMAELFQQAKPPIILAGMDSV
jgi:hypothetical protein